jgi:hypothetical protein
MPKPVGVYFAWDRPAETGADLEVIENRFATLFESRRILWPQLENFSNAKIYRQGIDGFFGNLLTKIFDLFLDHARNVTGSAVHRAERRAEDGHETLLDQSFLADIGTLIVISFDSLRARQLPSSTEIAAVAKFLSDSTHTVFVCPHHDLGDTSGIPEAEWRSRQEAEFHHHGDRTSPPQHRFGFFGTKLLEGLGTPAKNLYGLKPARGEDGMPVALDIDTIADRDAVMRGVSTFNLHPHLPHFEDISDKFNVVARQKIDPTAPLHPFTTNGQWDFNALLQAKSGIFAGRLYVCDATVWGAANGGLESLHRFWTNALSLAD